MPPSLDNPFRKPPRSKKEAEEISELLTGKERKGEKEVKEEKVPESDQGIELSSKEKAKAEKVDTTPWTREQMEEWAEKFGRSKGWVSDNLAQNQDGTWWADDLDLHFIKNGRDFPKGITVIHGDLNLGGLTSAEDLILPETIIGTIFIRKLKSVEHLILPANFKGGLSVGILSKKESKALKEKISKSLKFPSHNK